MEKPKHLADGADVPLKMWTVYDHPKDYPNSYVARLWLVGPGGAVPSPSLIISKSLDELQSMLLVDLHLHRLPRHPSDDPAIVETWI